MSFDFSFWVFGVRWLHVLSGVMWIGLLWYFNFVQVPSMPSIPDEQKPAITKVIAPKALFWFRWAALSTIVWGIILAGMNGYIGDALVLGLTTGNPANSLIGFGMWMGLFMAYNVWFIIWPAQQKVLGMVEVSAEEKPKAARKALMASRTNTMLSIPMLFSMVGAQNSFFT